jgi:hypothetical protein
MKVLEEVKIQAKNYISLTTSLFKKKVKTISRLFIYEIIKDIEISMN